MAITDNLAAHWNLFDNAENTDIVASVGSNATLLGGDNTSVLSASGPNAAVVRSLNFNNVDDAVQVSLSFSGAFSVNALCYFGGTGSYTIYGVTGAFSNRLIRQNTTAFRVSFATDFTVPSMSTNTWYMVTQTRDASNNMRIYLNGVESSTGAVTVSGTIAPTRIGQGSTVFYLGRMASFSVWSRALSGAEITELHNGGNWKVYPWASAAAIATLPIYGVEGIAA